MSKDIIVISVDTNTIHLPTELHGLVIIAMPSIPIHPPSSDELAELISKKDNDMRIYDFDRIKLESKQQNTNRRERVRFQDTNARVQSKIAQRAYQNKKQKGK